MKRIMIDTNVYEFLLKYIERSVLEDVLFQKRLIFYGSDIIRKELREIPKSRKETIGGQLKSLRNILLSLYDFVVEKHHYKTTKQMEELADKYFIVYVVILINLSKAFIILGSFLNFSIWAHNCSNSITFLDFLIKYTNRKQLYKPFATK